MPERKNLISAAEVESRENVIEILNRREEWWDETTSRRHFIFIYFFPFAYVRDSLLMVINDVDTAIPIVLPLFSLSPVFFFHGGEYIFIVRH
jgi:hypothetical protein